MFNLIRHLWNPENVCYRCGGTKKKPRLTFGWLFPPDSPTCTATFHGACAGRTSWVYCRTCGHDLNDDGESFEFADERGVKYVCAGCGSESLFDFDAPCALLLQHFTRPLPEALEVTDE